MSLRYQITEILDRQDEKLAAAHQMMGAMFSGLAEGIRPSEADEVYAMNYLSGMSGTKPLPWPKEWRKIA